MPVTQDKPGPYAPATAVLGIVERYRDRGLPTPITADVLARAGVTDSLIARTLYALQTLDLIGVDGMPTATFEAIRRAPQADYMARLGDWLTQAYSDALQFIDPATADETQVHDAFRGYTPPGQRDRMVTLFLGLFRAAGIAPEKVATSAPRKKVVAVRMATRVAPRKIEHKTPSEKPPFVAGAAGGLPPALAGLLASLPVNGEGWTQAQRDSFMNTFGVVLDFTFPPGVVRTKTAEDDDASDA